MAGIFSRERLESRGEEDLRKELIQVVNSANYSTINRLGLDKLTLVGTLDHKLKIKPKKRARRLIIVGDVHGCKTDCECFHGIHYDHC